MAQVPNGPGSQIARVPNGPGSQMVPNGGAQMALGPVPNGRARSQMVPKWRPRKRGVAWEWFPKLRLGDSPRPKWIVVYPGGLRACQFPPNPHQKMVLRGFPQFGKIGEGHLALPVYSLLALCGPIVLSNSRYTRAGWPILVVPVARQFNDHSLAQAIQSAVLQA